MKKVVQLYKLFFLMGAFIAALVAIRMKMSHSIQYIFLIWNLFLAWIPFEVSRHLKPNGNKLLNGLLFCIWLLFFPNALYIITDLIHIRDYPHKMVPGWYDAILIFSSSLMGLLFAFLSLFNAERFLRNFVSKKWMGWVTGGILFISSFGVYLGRFQRWNSWDIVQRPLALFQDIGERFVNPFEHLRTWAVTFILFGLFGIMYLFMRFIKLSDNKKM